MRYSTIRLATGLMVALSSIMLSTLNTQVALAQFIESEATTEVEPDAVADEDAAPESTTLTIEGTLSETSDVLDDGTYFNAHTFESEAGDFVTIDLSSDEFDTYVLLRDAEGNTIAENDDSDGTHSQIQMVLSAAGTYTIWVNSYEEAATGTYTLMLQRQDLSEIEALVQQLEEVRQGDDATAEIEMLEAIAQLYRQRGQHAEALGYLQQVVPLVEEMRSHSQSTDDEVAELMALMQLGEAYKAIGDTLDDLGQYGEAIATFQQGLKVAEEALDLAEDLDRQEDEFTIRISMIGTQRSLSFVYGSYGRAFSKNDQFDEARAVGQENIKAAKRMLSLSEAALDFAQDQENSNWIEQSNLNILSAYSTISFAYRLVGSIYQTEAGYFEDKTLFKASFNSHEEVVNLLHESLSFAVKSNNSSEEREALHDIAVAYWQLSRIHQYLKEYSESIRTAKHALELAEQNSLSSIRVMITFQLANAHHEFAEQYYTSGDHDKSLELLHQGLSYLDQVIELDAALTETENNGQFSRKSLEGRIGRRHDWQDTSFRTKWGIYQTIGRIYKAENNYEKVLETEYQALLVSQHWEHWSSQLSTLLSIVGLHAQLGEYREALEVQQQALDIAWEINEPSDIANSLGRRALIYSDLGRYPEAIEVYEEALKIAQDNALSFTEDIFLNNLSILSLRQGEYEKALVQFNKNLSKSREILGYLQSDDTTEFHEKYCFDWLGMSTESGQSELRQSWTNEYARRTRQLCVGVYMSSESKDLNSIATIYISQGRYQEALSLYEKSLDIAKSIKDSSGQLLDGASEEASVLMNIGTVYLEQGEYDKAADFLQNSLEKRYKLVDPNGIVLSLGHIGRLYENQGLYEEALSHLYDALNKTKELELLPLQSPLLGRIGFVHFLQGDYDQAENYYQQALDLSQSLGIVTAQASTFSKFGQLHFGLGNYNQALDYEKQALDIYQSIGQLDTQPAILNNMGRYYRAQANYVAALDAHQQALDIATDIGAQVNQAYSLEAMGSTYYALGDDEQALDSLRQALTRFRTIGHPEGEASTLNTMGTVYARQGKGDRAIETQQQALAIYQRMGHLAGESRSWQHIGFIREQLGDYTAAQNAFDQALDRQDQMGARGLQGTSLNGLGLAYHGQGEPDRALDNLQQALVLYRASGDPAGEGKALGDMGTILAEQGQVELAIAFLKRSINITEAIRGELQSLPRELQESYAETVSDRYRLLANLLLQQDRVLEAQEVLDLLKLQELDDFNLRSRGNEETAQGLDLWDAEQTILMLFDQHLVDNPDGDFDDFLDNDDLQQQVEQLRRNAQGQNLNPAQLEKLQDNLQQLGNAALLYPLVLDDRLELILVTTAGISRHTVAVDRPQLNRAILDFRADITDHRSNPIPNARRLYTWLMDPIAADLEAAGTDTILYAADGQLRYIPLAALHDGDQWLTHRYTINHITAASLTDFSRGEDRELQILAGAFSDVGKTYDFTIGDKQFRFNGLQFAGVEVDAIATEIPNTQAYFDQDFSRANVEPNMGDYSIVHFATHAEFVPGFPHESFILFGNGDRVSLRDISDWQLPNTDLVVLSACRTAVSGELGGGEEILGFGYQVQRTGARAAIASLWYVDDSGTQSLMTTFYTALQNGYSETEALRQAQIALVTNDFATVNQSPRGITLEPVDSTSPSPQTPPATLREQPTTHPYYWAPFILIGNGL